MENKSFCRSVFELLETLFSAFFTVILVMTFLVRFVTVEGDSMRNTLNDGDRILIRMLFADPDPGDIVVINADRSVTLDEDGRPVTGDGIHRWIVKRVIAREGQTVDIDFDKGIVTIDGQRLFEDYVQLGLTHKDEGAFTGKYPVTVPEGCVFVMGDNRSVSEDSRSADIGFVPEECIIGEMIHSFAQKN